MFQIKKQFARMLGAILFMSIAGGAYAQFVGPQSANRVTAVKEILQNPVEDQRVIVQGFIKQKLGDKYYMFADDTGEIRVEISRRRFNNQQISETTKVELRGEVDINKRGDVKIEVKRLNVLNPS